MAVENFALLSEGLTVHVEARLEHNRLISNVVLGGYVLAALAVLLLHYRAAGRLMSRVERERRSETFFVRLRVPTRELLLRPTSDAEFAQYPMGARYDVLLASDGSFRIERRLDGDTH